MLKKAKRKRTGGGYAGGAALRAVASDGAGGAPEGHAGASLGVPSALAATSRSTPDALHDDDDEEADAFL